MSIITVKNLDLWYNDNQALKNVCIDIEEKTITALIGPSGCGKSTFLKTLNRMNDLVHGVRITGEVQYDGMDILGKGVDVNELRRDIGMVFQKPNPFPMSIYDNIAYGPRTHGIKSKVKLDEIVEESLRDAAIWDEVKDRLKKSALSLSNLGAVQLPDVMKPYIQRMDFILGTQATSPYNCGVLSYDGTLYINFIRDIREPVLEERFCRVLQELGLNPTVQTNRPQR